MTRFALVLVSLLFAPAMFAQTGFPLYGSQQAGTIDSVNLQDLNVNFAIPLINAPGRGTSFTSAVYYNTMIWAPNTGTWEPVAPGGYANFGWMAGYPFGTITNQVSETEGNCGRCIAGDGCQGYTDTQLLSGYTYVDAAGTAHYFSVYVNSIYNSCTNSTSYSGTYAGYSLDGLYYLNLDGVAGNPPTTLWVYNVSSGTKIDLGSSNFPIVTDRNGNQITANSDGSGGTNWIDTTGRTAAHFAPAGAAPTTFKYTDPSGAIQTFTLKWQNYNVMTNFGCSGIPEYNSAGTMPPISLPYELDLPNGKKYTFTYESTPGHSTYTTARISLITLPTGGTYSYAYGSTNDGINCADASIDNLTRTITGGSAAAQTVYVRTGIIGHGGTTTVTAPLMPWDSASNQYVYTFNTLGQQTQELDYQGSSTSGTLLKTVNTTWATNGSPATQKTILPFTPSNLQSEIDTTYDGNGHLQQKVEYDWGSGATGTLIKTTNLGYSTIAATVPFEVLSGKTVLNSSGTIQWRVDIAYDGSTPTCVSGVGQHDYTNFGCSYNHRGNVTSSTTYTNASVPSGGVVKTFTYDVFGNPLISQTGSVQQTQANFSSSTNYAYPDTTIVGPSTGTQLTTTYTYNAYTGQIASYKDPNGQQYSFTYDLLKRPTVTTRPDSQQLSKSYNDTALTVTSLSPIDSSGKKTQIVTTYDALGRPSTIATEDVSGAVYSTVLTQYDPVNRPFQTSDPYIGSPGYCTATTWYCTQTNFDALGRKIKTILQDNSYSTVSYSGNCATSTDPTGRSRESCADGSGRMTKVVEDPTGLNYETDYSYDAPGDLIGVSQGVQTRTYTYDGMGRIASSATPEAGTIQSQYNNFDEITQRTDARGVITTYGYDTLNRPSTVSYNVTGAVGVPTTTGLTFTYDTGGAPAFALGRLTKMTDAAGSETYSYDLLGRITALSKVINSKNYPVSYGYNYAGETTSVTYPSGRVVDQSYDAIGRLCAISATANNCSPSSYFAKGYSYGPSQQITGFNLGNGVAAAFSYSGDRLQLTSLAYTVSSSTLFGLNYWYKHDSTNCSSGSTNNNGQIQCITDNVDSGRTAEYGYDSLYRIDSAITNGDTSYPQWGLSWTYDRYGNRLTQTVTAGSAPANSLTVLPASNHISGTGFSYDSSGNMTGDGVNTMTYDAENHTVSSGSSSGSAVYVYNGIGLRVEKCLPTCASPTSSTVYIFSGKNVIAEYDNGAAVSAPTRENVYSGKTLVATIDSTGTKYILRDHLSARLITNASGGKVGEQGHFPYGEQWYAANTTTKWKFTTYERDAESGNDYAQARYYVNRLGRFASPDPLSGHPRNPQSLNRYSYALNDPLNLFDLTGRDACGGDPDDEFDSSSWHHGHRAKRVETAAHIPERSDVVQDDGSDDSCGDGKDVGGGGGDGDDDGDNQSGDPNQDDLPLPLPLTQLPPDCGMYCYSLDPNANQVNTEPQAVQGVDTNPDNSGCPGENSIFCKMMDPSQCPQCVPIFNGDSQFVDLSTAAVGLGLAAAVAAPVVVEVGLGIASTVGDATTTTLTVARTIALNPDVVGAAGDFLSGFSPGPPTLTLGALAGLAAADLIHNASEIWQTVKAGIWTIFTPVGPIIPE